MAQVMVIGDTYSNKITAVVESRKICSDLTVIIIITKAMKNEATTKMIPAPKSKNPPKIMKIKFGTETSGP